ncbi:isoprenoid synthase domain-containing protein [Aspergillus novoparasiticus]|uniref:Isoprenoid synthase domain-containing protein n=1 Tax=Aspergillus novoparasiticus TaxID=986946 RepID=A0A5N6E8Y9_9EURO|nr:isoprenoid synthase domain-containing protein [Aspergillus novoparasiticus]
MSLLISAQEYHASRIDPGPIPSTFEEFMERRLVYSGFHVFAKFIGLAMDFRAPDESMSMIEDVTRPLERAMALCNDYFSWPKDKEHFQQGKGANTVAFLQQVEGISEEEALESIKRQIIALEESHNSALEHLMNASTLSPDLQSYLSTFRLAAGGLHFFTSTSDRYLPPGSAIAQPIGSVSRSSMICGVLFIVTGVIFLFFYLCRSNSLASLHFAWLDSLL